MLWERVLAHAAQPAAPHTPSARTELRLAPLKPHARVQAASELDAPGACSPDLLPEELKRAPKKKRNKIMQENVPFERNLPKSAKSSITFSLHFWEPQSGSVSGLITRQGM